MHTPQRHRQAHTPGAYTDIAVHACPRHSTQHPPCEGLGVSSVCSGSGAGTGETRRGPEQDGGGAHGQERGTPGLGAEKGRWEQVAAVLAHFPASRCPGPCGQGSSHGPQLCAGAQLCSKRAASEAGAVHQRRRARRCHPRSPRKGGTGAGLPWSGLCLWEKLGVLANSWMEPGCWGPETDCR